MIKLLKCTGQKVIGRSILINVIAFKAAFNIFCLYNIVQKFCHIQNYKIWYLLIHYLMLPSISTQA